MPSSNAARIAKVRSAVGVQDENQISSEEIEEEIERGKRQISEEVRQMLDAGETLSFENAEGEALDNFVNVRVTIRVNGKNGEGNGPPDHANAKTPSHVRRTDFKDAQMNSWRDNMVSALSRIYDNG